jgi:hypothetical protein
MYLYGNGYSICISIITLLLQIEGEKRKIKCVMIDETMITIKYTGYG